MKILSHFLFLLCLPSFLLSPISLFAFHSESQHSILEFDLPRDALGRVNPWILLQPENLSLDRYFAFIELTENEAFLTSLTEEEFDLVVNFVTHMVEASVPDSFEDLKELYRFEIDKLLEDLYGEPKWTLNDSFDFEYIPAISLQNPDYLLCKSWFKNKAHHFGHWCKKHKKPLIIGAVVVGVVTVTVLTGGVGGSSAVAVGGALVNESLNEDSPPIYKPGEIYEEDRRESHPPPTFPKEEITTTLITQANKVKEELYHRLPDEPLNIPPEEEPSFWESAYEVGRNLISQGSHQVYDFIYEQVEPLVDVNEATHTLIAKVSPELGEQISITTTHESFKEHVERGHEKIDGVLHTDYSALYSDEAKAAKGEITTGVLPFPGAGGTKIKSSSVLLDQEMNHILKEVNQIKANHPHLKTDRVISNVCNKGNLNEVQIRQVLNRTGFNPPPRPMGIPDNFVVKVSDNGGGIKYRLEVPKRGGKMYPKVEIRVMKGNPNSPNVGQQRSYVVHRVNGKFLDKNGNIVSRKGTEPHIPFEEYDFEKLSKLVPYE
ncbi:MAG: hypothetical protein KFB93_00135 [Simkaniaceae bacterium]|nr:MAG: hypothetical protein KFB93_00135 [Simkaniaceae bacterium]